MTQLPQAPSYILRLVGAPPPAPEGYEHTGEFRPPRKGEHYLAPWSGPLLAAGNDEDYDQAYHILRPVTPPTPPEGYELTGEFRPPREGEGFFSECGCRGASARFDYETPRHILRRVPQRSTVEAVLRALAGTNHAVTIFTGPNVYDVSVEEAGAQTCRLIYPDGRGITTWYGDISCVVAK